MGPVRKKRKLSYWLFVRLPIWFIAGSLLLVTLFKWVPVRYTPVMLKRAVQLGTLDIRQEWVPLEKISPEIIKAVIAGEDNRFSSHHGFDWKEIGLMWKEHFDKGRKLRGCSTLSQQTAKNVFTFGSPTFVRKGLECWWTLLIEWIWGKRRIMEVYLNVAELGQGLFGVEAACRKYWDIPSQAADRDRAASLAIALPSPLRYAPDLPRTAYLQRRKAQILRIITQLSYPEWLNPVLPEDGSGPR